MIIWPKLARQKPIVLIRNYSSLHNWPGSTAQMLKNLTFLTILVFLVCLIQSASATSVSFLYGDGFRNDQGYAEHRTTMTIEHFGLWKYGTVFFYYDITDPFHGTKKEGSNQFFGGISPTISLSKITGKNYEYGLIKDISIRVELENGSANGEYRFRNYFYGLQADLYAPGFDFLSLNMVARDNPNQPGVGVQFGGFWQMTFDYGQYHKYKFTGFFAYSPRANQPNQAPFKNRGAFFMSQPQLLYDLGNTWGEANSVEVGVEYLYSHNRFQIAGKHEKVLQAILKMSF